MNITNKILFILSIINFMFVGFGGLHSASEITLVKKILPTSSALTFDNDQVYKVETENYPISITLFSELLEENEERNQIKIQFSYSFCLESVKNNHFKPKSDSHKSLITKDVDRYLLLQTFRL
jgi:hypothetical protein